MHHLSDYSKAQLVFLQQRLTWTPGVPEGYGVCWLKAWGFYSRGGWVNHVRSGFHHFHEEAVTLKGRNRLCAGWTLMLAVTRKIQSPLRAWHELQTSYSLASDTLWEHFPLPQQTVAYTLEINIFMLSFGF